MGNGNRLASESSPYLRQHADNPVDWYPWGTEALQRARELDRPILLSVGYSACHWCHVMAHESFEDPRTAAVMNRYFVNVKVDREERPDIDAVYMEAVQAMTGHGGWPMTVFLTPDGRPFFGGTYFPPTSRHGLPSFTQLLERVHELWEQRRGDVEDQADHLTAALADDTGLGAGGPLPGDEALEQAAATLVSLHDARWGGFGRAPKFPQAMSQEFLLQRHVRGGDGARLDAVTTTLDAMASGGIYDHLGGGFCRYSVDDRWVVPHFEKMLYDNALLARLYLHAWQITGWPPYRQVVDETIGYLLRDLRHRDGGFFAAEDADSEGEEGRFYVFDLDEVRAALAAAGRPELFEDAVAWYGMSAEGNFEGRNIPLRPVRGDLLRPPAIEEARQALFELRSRRVRPGLDDKVLTEWNGLALATLAEAAAATGDRDWLDAARRTGEFLCASLRRDGRWLRSWQSSAGPRHLGYAADYAAMVDAFVRLAEATGEARWVAEAVDTATGLVELFWDPDRGGLHTTGHDAEALVVRPRDLLDNAVPSANSLAAVAFQRLGALTGDRKLVDRAHDIMRLVGDAPIRHPAAFGHMLVALDLASRGQVEVAVVGDLPDLVTAVQRRYLPNGVLAWGEPWASPLWEGRPAGAAYVCRDYTCQLPAPDVATLEEQLDEA